MADKDLEDGDTVSSEDHDDQDFMAEENGEEMVDEEGGLHVDGLYIAPPPPPSLSFESQGPRLIISHIECENFKSFSGIQVLGPFHKNFTSIIGPNGSGKSNVIDAMLFVFGYRAQKIRSKKISVLIHSSSHFENIQSCKVTVFFQEIIDSGNEQHQVVPDSLFKVSRSAFRDNSSFYEIDGKKSLFKDVARLLRSKGVDLDHNRFLILQGEVEQIALMKPKAQHETDVGMLEFLEDIIGSSRFKEPIRIIQQRIGDIDELRVEKVNRVKIVEKEKEDLEKPKNEAVQYLIQKNEIARKKNLINQYHVSSNEAKLQNIQKKQAEFVEGSKLLLEKMKEVGEKKASKETELKHLSNQLTQMNKDVDEKSQLFQKNELQHGQLLEEMRNTNVHRKRLGAQLKAEQDHYAQLVKVPEDNQKKIAELTQHKSSLEAELAKVSHKHDEELTSLHKVTKDFQDKQDKLETELIDLQKETSLKESQYNVAKSGLDFLLSTEQKELCKLKQLQEKATTSRSELQNRESQLAEYSDAFPLLRKTVASMETELNSLNQKYESSYKKVSGIRGEVEEKRSKQTATKHWGAVHDALMRQKHAGTIPGIFGRLGDLGAIDRQYDVAVSTAAGSSLDTILVDSIDTAKACIEYLKRNDVGRANLLALDKTNRWTGQVKANFKGPENAPRLIDLIKLENESFRTAFYQYMRDTLVAKDMEQARRIAFGTKRYRVVTLSGEVIETSGAMAGGGKERLQGKMGSQIQKPVNETDLHQLEKALQSELSELDSVTESKARLEQQLVQGKRDLVEKDKLMAKLKLDVKKLQDDCVTLKAQMEAQQRVVLNSKPDSAALQQKQGEVDELKKELDVAAENSAQVKDRVLQLNNKIKEITSSKMKPLKAKLDNLTGQLDKVKQEMTRLEVGISSSERDMKKSKDKCDCYQTEVIDAENKLRQIKETRDTLEQSNLNIAQELKGLKQEEVKLEKQQKVLRDQLSKIESEETQCKSEHINFEQALSTYTEQIKECKKRVALLKQELASLRLEELPDGQQVEGLCTHTHNELQAVDIKALTYQVELMVEQMSNLHPNLSVIDEYTKKKEMYLLRLQELDQITARRDGQKRRLDELRKMRLKEFMLGFGLISSKLKETYQMITLGGDAELELIDRLDPFSEGILFSVRPPNKSWKNMSKLSGGEKTLSSLALVFALHYYKPTPLYVMDEIDAALDFKNVSIVALYIKEKTKNAQFVVISLRPNMFELADRLVGICKPDNCTKAFTINPAELIR